jgi:hypothetical protein
MELSTVIKPHPEGWFYRKSVRISDTGELPSMLARYGAVYDEGYVLVQFDSIVSDIHSSFGREHKMCVVMERFITVHEAMERGFL